VASVIANADITKPTNFGSTLTGVATAANIAAIEAANGTGTIDGAGITSLSGSAAEVIQALVDLDVGSDAVPVTITDQPTLSQLKSINDATAGAITLRVTGGALSGSAEDLAAALSGITSYTGNLTVTSQPTLAELVTINNATGGSIVLKAATVPLAGTASDLTAAFAGITAYDGVLTVTDNLSGSEGVTAVSAIATATAAAIATRGTLSATVAQLANLGTVATDIVNIVITDTGESNVVPATALSGIGGKTAGSVTVSNALNVSGSLAELKAAFVTDATSVSASLSNAVMTDVGDTTVLTTDVKAIAGLVNSVAIANGVTLVGSQSEVVEMLNLSNLTLTSSDFNVTVTGAFGIDSNLIAMLNAIAQSTTGDLSIVGSSFTDVLDASSFNGDGSQGLLLSGGNGNDTLTGTAFADFFTGGAGADTFKFFAGSTGTVSGPVFDVITDYTRGVGGDKLDLVGSATAAANVSGTDVATVSANSGKAITASIANGVLTVADPDANLIDSLTEWLAVARAMDTVDTKAVAFQFNGDTYVYQENSGGDLLIQLDNVVEVTAVGTSGVVGQIWIS